MQTRRPGNCGLRRPWPPVRQRPRLLLLPTHAKPFADETKTLISLDGVYQKLDRSGAGAKVLLADCCRTDPAGGRGRDIPNDVLDKTPPKGVYAFFSCGKGEKAFEHKDLQHGVFFYQVLEGLKGAAEDSDDDVTFKALTLQVRKRVPTEVHRLFGDTTHQTPTLKMVEASGAPLVLLSGGRKRSMQTLPRWSS